MFAGVLPLQKRRGCRPTRPLAEGELRADAQSCAQIFHASKFCENAPQVLLAKDQYSVQALTTHRTDQTLHIRILPRTSRRRGPVPNAHRLQPRPESIPKGAVIIAPDSPTSTWGRPEIVLKSRLPNGTSSR